ncbi:MAG: sigma-70 family RNA polymerase sigma factor [Acidimicrobiia bacterium]
MSVAARRRPSIPRRCATRSWRRTPSDDVLDALGTEEALAIVSTLPPDQAEVVALRTIGGLDVQQVAEVIGKRPGTVRVLAHRGLKNLAKTLGAPVALDLDTDDGNDDGQDDHPVREVS